MEESTRPAARPDLQATSDTHNGNMSFAVELQLIQEPNRYQIIESSALPTGLTVRLQPVRENNQTNMVIQEDGHLYPIKIHARNEDRLSCQLL